MGRTRLKCRIDGCQDYEVFDSPQNAKNSDWTDICPVGGLQGGPEGVESVHRAYCPGHSFEDL